MFDEGVPFVLCINKNNGSIIWSDLHSGAGGGYNPILYGNKLFVASGNGTLVYQADNGKRLYRDGRFSNAFPWGRTVLRWKDYMVIVRQYAITVIDLTKS